MKTVYLDRHFRPLCIDLPQPGDVHHDPVLGDCRRVTPSRLCLAAERAGRESDALLSLLRAIGKASVSGSYDGRSLESWYGLVGLEVPPPPSLETQLDALMETTCPKCGIVHWCLPEDDGSLPDGGVCLDCQPAWVPNYSNNNYLIGEKNISCNPKKVG